MTMLVSYIVNTEHDHTQWSLMELLHVRTHPSNSV